jgi:hypothetical protein
VVGARADVEHALAAESAARSTARRACRPSARLVT